MLTVVCIMLFLFAVGFVRAFPYPRLIHRKATNWNMLVDCVVYLNIAVAIGWFTYFVWPFVPALNLTTFRERPIEFLLGWAGISALSGATFFWALMAFFCATQIYENVTGGQFAER
jgi:hypothetical protein